MEHAHPTTHLSFLSPSSISKNSQMNTKQPFGILPRNLTNIELLIKNKIQDIFRIIEIFKILAIFRKVDALCIA